MANAKPSKALQRRAEPVQARARETWHLIIETAAQLLDETGIDGFNTNLLAEQAGLRVRTVYRYFPNKYAVIAALTEQLAVQWNSWNEPFYAALADRSVDWRPVLRRTIDNWMRKANKVPGSVSVLQAINATPELRDLHQSIFEEMCARFSSALVARGCRHSRAQLQAVAHAAVSALNAGGDTFFQLRGNEAQRYLEELYAMQEAYLARYLD
ncbi:MAG TPA: hypothetical protein DD491_09610 [Halieaceae bacterium]|nr:hypothetical protein [Halieaceae bacterium]|tara:strand:- start:333 stop:968 length:636 start_codon:yes stop_codon:yes gene_type:complete